VSEPTFQHARAALEDVVDDCARRSDPNGYFPAMYLSVTREVEARCRSGWFDDAGRMEVFVASFAQRYLDAWDAWRRDEACTSSWRVAFEAARSRRTVILQHLALGMNAHINLDLGVAVAELAGAGPVEALHHDFDAVNDVLGSLVPEMKSVVGAASPFLGALDRVGGASDDELVRFSLRVARREAWRAAERLAALRRQGAGELSFATAVDELDRATTRLARGVRSPGGRLSAALLVVRLGERAPVPRTIVRLASIR
jgi:hypothetical protein